MFTLKSVARRIVDRRAKYASLYIIPLSTLLTFNSASAANPVYTVGYCGQNPSSNIAIYDTTYKRTSFVHIWYVVETVYDDTTISLNIVYYNGTPDPITFQGVASIQFNWLARYPDPDIPKLATVCAKH